MACTDVKTTACPLCGADSIRIGIAYSDGITERYQCLRCGHMFAVSAEEDEARDMALVDAMIAVAEQNGETGYDGVRAYHSDIECRGGNA